MPPMKKRDSTGPSNTNRQDGSSSLSQLSDSEDWTKLTDISSRRRVQNRLAQRHRRKKLREEKEPQAKTPEPAQERSLTARRNSVSTTMNREPMPEQSKHHESTSCLPVSSNLSDGQLNLTLNIPDLSMSRQETKTLLSQLDQAQSQLQEFLSEKCSDYQHPMQRPVRDLTASQQTYWDPSVVSPFDENNMGTMFNNFGQLSLPIRNADDATTRPNGFHPNSREDAISTMTQTGLNLSQTTATTTATTSSEDYLYMTPPKLFLPKPEKTTLSSSRISNFNPSKESPTDPTPSTSSATAPSTSHGNDINVPDNTRGNTALHLAAQQGHLETVRILLKIGGVDINAINQDGMSALHVAITQGNTEITRLLLESGASSSLRNNNCQSTLHLAVENGGVALVQLLLQYVTTDLDSRDLNGKSAFHLAVEKGEEEIVRSMLLKGVNPRAKVGEQTPAVEEMSFDWSIGNIRELE